MPNATSWVRIGVMVSVVSALAACGGGGGSGTAPAPVANAVVHRSPLVIRDAPSEDWASVAVKVVSVSLTASDGSSVVVYQPTTPALINLAQLDQLSEQLAGAIPPGTYTGATLTLAANPGDVVLTVSQDPESVFVGTPGAVIPASQTVITGASGATGAMTVTVPITFRQAVSVASSASTPVQIDFNLGHPAFVITHSVTGGMTVYSVTFTGGTVSPHPVANLTSLVLRHLYGSVASVSSDNTSLTVNREVPTLPIVSPETAVALGTTDTVLADATHGTLFYDLDSSIVPSTITDYSTVAANLAGKQVRIEARYQADGSLVATRVFSASAFATVWRSPEGHVLRVDATNGTMTVSGEDGTPVTLTVDASTQFTLPNQPATAPSIGSGPSFLSNLRRGFKVHVTVDTTTATLARLVEIESAAFSGRIANATTTQFDVQADFSHHADAYAVTLPYVSPTTVTDVLQGSTPVTGFSYWNFAYPTEVVSTAAATSTTAAVDAIAQFVSATNGSVGFGGIWPAVYAAGETHAVWGDAANPNGWSSPWVDLTPTKIPTGWVSTAVSGNQFAISAPGGAVPVTVSFDTTPGSATLVYAVSRANDAVSVTSQDVSTSAGLAAMTSALSLNARVRVSGIPQADGTFKAYVITYFTGTQPVN